MKKLIILSIVAAILLCGCCTRMANNVETKSFTNCLIIAQDYVCNPPAEVVAVAGAAIPVIVMVINTLVPGTAEYITATSVAATASTIQKGGCVFLTDLNALIAYLQTPAVKSAQAKMMKAKAVPKAIDVQVLLNWEVQAKK